MIFHLCRQSVSNIKSYKLTVVISQCVYCFFARVDYSAVCESELANYIDFCMGCIYVEVVCCVWCTALRSQPIVPNTVLTRQYMPRISHTDVSVVRQLNPMYCSPLLLLYLCYFRRYLYHWRVLIAELLLHNIVISWPIHFVCFSGIAFNSP
jgi:hypothetical protein